MVNFVHSFVTFFKVQNFMENAEKNPIKGGEFIIRNATPNEIFTPEEWSEEQEN